MQKTLFEGISNKPHNVKVQKDRERSRDYTLRNPGRSNKRKRRFRLSWVGHTRMYNRKSKYGLTMARWEEMWERQQGKCGVCGEEMTRKQACVDHNHKTRRVRDLLCNSCNSMIGFCKENEERLRMGIEYLRRWA